MIRMLDLTPRQSRTALDIATAAVIVSVAVALAGLTWRIAGHASTGAVTVPSGARPVTQVADITPALAFAPFGKGTSEAMTATALPLKLKGVFAASPAALSVAYIEVGSEPAKPFRIGEAPGGGVIEGILRDRVLLRVNGRIEFLAFPDPTLTAEQQTAALTQPQPAPPSPPQVSTSPAQPPAAAAASALAGLAPAPGGGLLVGASAPPGLRQGDVVTSINGTPVTSQASAAAALAAAQASGQAQVQITRDGRPVTLTVPTR
jgi:general secretion pathway protein C